MCGGGGGGGAMVRNLKFFLKIDLKKWDFLYGDNLKTVEQGI